MTTINIIKKTEKTPKVEAYLIWEKVFIKHRGNIINIVIEKHTNNLVLFSPQKLSLAKDSILVYP